MSKNDQWYSGIVVPVTTVWVNRQAFYVQIFAYNEEASSFYDTLHLNQTFMNELSVTLYNIQNVHVTLSRGFDGQSCVSSLIIRVKLFLFCN